MSVEILMRRYQAIMMIEMAKACATIALAIGSIGALFMNHLVVGSLMVGVIVVVVERARLFPLPAKMIDLLSSYATRSTNHDTSSRKGSEMFNLFFYQSFCLGASKRFACDSLELNDGVEL
jgi:hypothetical protein